MENKSAVSAKTRKVLLKVLIAFFVVMIVLTFLSSSIRNYMLPEVKLLELKQSTLSINAAVDARAEYVQTMEVKAPADGYMQDKGADRGMMVTEGSSMAKFVNADGSPGEVLAPADGEVIAMVAGVYANVKKGDTLYIIGLTKKGFNLRWTMNRNRADYFNVGGMVTVCEMLSSGLKQYDAKIFQKTASKDGSTYEFVAAVDRYKKTELRHGKQVMMLFDKALVLTSEGQPATHYLIPRQSVVDFANDTAKVYVVAEKNTLFGTETMVRILEIKTSGNDAFYYSTNNPWWGYGSIRGIVYSSSKPLYDGATVKISEIQPVKTE